MDKIIDYMVVRESETEHIGTIVKQFIELGWQPLGGPYVVSYQPWDNDSQSLGGVEGIVYQAMVKYAD